MLVSNFPFTGSCRKIAASLLASVVAGMFGLNAIAPVSAAVITGDTADHAVNANSQKVDATAQVLTVGQTSSGFVGHKATILIFDLTTAPTPTAAGDVTLTFDVTAKGTSNATPTIDLYGLGFFSTATADTSAEFYWGDDDTDDTRLAEDVVTWASAAGEYNVSNAALATYLQNRPAGEAGKYVYFRLNLSAAGATNQQFYSIASADNTTASLRPTLTVVPEPASAALLALGGLTLLGRSRKD